jgi:hypothetical protein
MTKQLHKYTVDVTLIFDSEADIPDMNFRGEDRVEVERMFAALPPSNTDKVFASIKISRV